MLTCFNKVEEVYQMEIKNLLIKRRKFKIKDYINNISDQFSININYFKYINQNFKLKINNFFLFRKNNRC